MNAALIPEHLLDVWRQQGIQNDLRLDVGSKVVADHPFLISFASTLSSDMILLLSFCIFERIIADSAAACKRTCRWVRKSERQIFCDFLKKEGAPALFGIIWETAFRN